MAQGQTEENPPRRGRSRVSAAVLASRIADEAEQRISHLEARVRTMEEEIEGLPASSARNVIVLRSISRERAKEEIRALFQSGEVLYYSDISRRLRIELPLVVEMCAELREEGGIGVHDDTV